MPQKRKLSTIEHILDGNIVCFVRLQGSFHADRLRLALSRVQRKHPALRALIRQEPDGLYYETDNAPEIPLRILPRVTEEDYQRECRNELTTDFEYGDLQFRAVWLQSDAESDLLFVTSHRICDGMSIFIIVREVLRSLHANEDLIPYQPVTVQDIIDGYQPPRPWKRKLAAGLINALLRLVPNSRRAPEKDEHHLEWIADRALSDALKQRCKAEGVSVHALLVVALDRALLAVFGKEKLPKWIDNQIDPRRGRCAALQHDTVFFGGGSFRVRTGQTPDLDFRAKVRAVHEEIRRAVEKEIVEIPSRFHFFEMLRPPANGQIRSIVRMNDALRRSGGVDCFPLSNLGNVAILDSDAPFRLKDLRLYVHSFKTRAIGLVTYTVNGEMRFYCLSDEKCVTRSQVDALRREFMDRLRHYAIQPGDVPRDVPRMAAATAG